jgi:hypothetical protein
MTSPPISREVGAAVAQYFHGGSGPSHSKLSSSFAAAGYGDADPYDAATSTPNKEQRVLTVFAAAVRRPARARDLVEALLLDLRIASMFDRSSSDFNGQHFATLRAALRRTGWDVTDDGEISPMGEIDLTTGGREALDEQLLRLRRSTDDSAALLGSAKDLLEAVAKFVLEEVGMPLEKSADFGHLWHIARDRLKVLPQQVDPDLPGANSIRAVLQSSWTIAEQVNALRNVQGVGHGRTLPTGVSAELALLMVREACSVAEFMLTTLDRHYGRR